MIFISKKSLFIIESCKSIVSYNNTEPPTPNFFLSFFSLPFTHLHHHLHTPSSIILRKKRLKKTNSLHIYVASLCYNLYYIEFLFKNIYVILLIHLFLFFHNSLYTKLLLFNLFFSFFSLSFFNQLNKV